MSYDELIKWGMKHYNEGGDVFVECWSKSDYNEYIAEFGELTEEDVKFMARMYSNAEYGEW